MPPSQIPTHSPQLNTSLNKSTESLMLHSAPALAIDGLVRKTWWEREGKDEKEAEAITATFKESQLKFLDAEKEPSPQLTE